MNLTSFIAAGSAGTTNWISFPGLGIGEIKVNETAFTIPGTNITVAWYGIIIMVGIIVAFTYLYFMGKRTGLILDDLLDIAIFTVIPGIVGARAYYVFFDWLRNPDNYKSFYDVISIWNGGIAIYGAVIFGALGCFLTLRHKKIRVPLFFDCLCPAVMIAQSIGRWGNFVNGEAYGAVTSSPLAMTIRSTVTYLSESGQTFEYSSVVENVHPTFLYESVWNLVGFILLTILLFHKKYDGQVTLGYFTWYGAGRMFIEGLRQDSLYIGKTSIRVSQLLAFCFFIIAGFLFVFFMIKIKGKKLAFNMYLPGAKSAATDNDSSDKVDESVQTETGEAEKDAEDTAENAESAPSDGAAENAEAESLPNESEKSEDTDKNGSDDN